MKSPLRYLLPVFVTLGALVLVLYSRASQVDFAEHQRFDRKLDELGMHDSMLSQDVLKSRFRVLRDYDSLGAEIEALRTIVTELAETPSFVPEAGRKAFRSKLADFATLLAAKEQVVEAFESQNAMLNNSLRYLPTASTDLLVSLAADEEGRKLEEPMTRLMQQVFVHCLQSAEDEEPAIRQSLELLATWGAEHPAHPQAAAVNRISAHIVSIVSRKPKVEALTEQIVAIPTERYVKELVGLYDLQLAAALNHSDLLRKVLGGLCALLLSGIGYTVYALGSAKRHLEHRVAERTAELQALFDLIPALIWFKDTENNFLRVNQRVVETTGKPIGQIEGKSAYEIYPQQAAGYYADDLEVMASGRPKLGIVEKLRGPDDGELWIQTGKVPVFDKKGKLTGIVVMALDITARKRAERELETLHKQLLETSRQAGMAEVATGVLHNVGNVLNSVNVSATLVAESVRKSKAGNLGRVVALLDGHSADLGAFVTTDTQGKNLPTYLRQLHERLGEEQLGLLAEVDSLRQNIEHIKDIVSMQQEYAKVSGVTEVLKVTDLVEDSLRMNGAALTRHQVEVVREYQDLPAIAIEKHKALQVLVNLIRNAKYACDEGGRKDKRVTVRVANGDGRIKISVADNGIGIPPENLTRIFNHGFTTRKEGHGFGLHSGALAARDMGGSLSVVSAGLGCGATFTLELPAGQPTS